MMTSLRRHSHHDTGTTSTDADTTTNGSGSNGSDEENQRITATNASCNNDIGSSRHKSVRVRTNSRLSWSQEMDASLSHTNPKPVKTATVAWLQPPSSPAQNGSYLQHRSARGFRLESNTSDFESDVMIQEAQSKMLREKQQEQLQESMRSTSSGGIPRIHIHHSDSLQKLQRKGFIAKLPTGLVSALIFLVLVGAGVAVGIVIGDAQSSKIQEDAIQIARETGQFFSEQLDKAILPLFSMAQFAVHLEAFQVLPDLIGVAGADGSLPLDETTWKRNITGVCDDPELMETFADIATTIKSQSHMDGILANIQLAPNGVICLLYPMNNTEDFKDDGMHLDNTPVWGLDIFHDPGMKYIALQSIKQTEVGVAGPLKLKQCPECDPFFIARLPVMDDHHTIDVDGTPYHRWGFATALIAWTALVEQSGVYDTFENNQFEFQMTRTDNNLNTTTSEYDEVKVVLAETPTFREKSSWRKVSTSLETTNNEWVMTVSYDDKPVHRTIGLVIGSCVVMAFLIAGLVYTVLSQKHEHDDMLVEGYAQEARVATERNMTAYFAHELRNPLSAMDSALSSITTADLPDRTRELLDSMQLCSSFMSSIMNNLLDVRKIEEGKMRIRSKPISLSKLIDSTHSMMKPLVRQGVEFKTVKVLPEGRTWVLGDEHRIQQVLTNVITNAIKYTLHGSITLSVFWQEHFVVLECEDTGPGIPKSEHEHMFERFVQRGGAPGTGLGLNIAQKIVNMMDGSIGFDSDPTIAPGTTCRIMLPLLLCAEPDDGSLYQNSKEVEMIEDPINIMIIDDIRMNRTMLSRRIKKAIAPNATITLAETAEEALDLCESIEFDVIICDQYMEEAGGVMVGTDAIIAMRRMNVRSYIIGCSGNDLDNEFYDAGANMVWGKPLPPNGEIIQQLKRGLEERRAFEESAL